MPLLLGMLMIGAPARAADSKDAGLAKASQLYRAGDLDAAIRECEALLIQNPGHAPAKKLLPELLVAAAVESYLLGDEDASYRRLSRAMDLSPDTESVSRMYEKVKRARLKTVPAPSQPLPSDAGQFLQAVEKIVENQKAAMQQTQGAVQQMAEAQREQTQKIAQSLEQRESWLAQEIRFGRKSVMAMIVLGTLCAFLAIAVVLWTIQRIAARRERLLSEQTERFAQIIQEQSGRALEQLRDAMASRPQLEAPSGGRPLGIEDDTSSKLRRIDIIDAEIIEGKDVSDAGVLKKLLEDPDPQVRARTIQVLFKTDSEEAYRRIEEMLSSASPRIRLLAVQLLGGIATAKSAGLLIRLLKDGDVSVKRETIAALKNLLNEDLSEALKEEIQLALSFISEKEGWIVK